MIIIINKIAPKFLFVILSLSLLMSCNNKFNGTSTGNPKVALAATGSSSSVIASARSLKQKIWSILFNEAIALPSPPNLFDSAGNSVVLTSFWINFGNVEFEQSQTQSPGETNGSDIIIAGPLTVDLLTPYPKVFGPFTLPSSSFKRLKYKSENLPNPISNSPAGLTGNSIYFNGSVSGSSFAVQISDQIEIQVGGSNPLAPPDGSRLLLQISTVSIFSKIDLTSLVGTSTIITSTNRIPQTNPCPMINPAAPDLYTCFLGSIAPESNVGEDLNLDFQIDNGEPAIK